MLRGVYPERSEGLSMTRLCLPVLLSRQGATAEAYGLSTRRLTQAHSKLRFLPIGRNALRPYICPGLS
jgi:hypothetical protein